MMNPNETIGYSLAMFDDIPADTDQSGAEILSPDANASAPEEEIDFQLNIVAAPYDTRIDTAVIPAVQPTFSERLSNLFSSRAARTVAAIGASCIAVAAMATTLRNAISPKSVFDQAAPALLDQIQTQSVLNANQLWVIPKSDEIAQDSFRALASPR